MDRAQKGLNNFLDKHEGREAGSSNKAIDKERVRQGYKKVAKKMSKKFPPSAGTKFERDVEDKLAKSPNADRFEKHLRNTGH